MTWDDLFSMMNLAAVAGWAVLILAPRRIAWLGALPRLVVPAAIGLIYAALMGAHFAAAGGGYGSIAAVRALFASDPVLVAGWGHYLAFDLIVGALIADRMDAARVSRLVQAPVLVAVFLFGPVGWLLGLAAATGATAATAARGAAPLREV